MVSKRAVEEHLWQDDHIDVASAFIKALAQPIRMKILWALDDREACAMGITKVVGTTKSNISQHLVDLRNQGFLVSRRESHRVLYRIVDLRLLDMIKISCQIYTISIS